MKDIDRYRGSLIGGAAGDALGYAVEFMGESSIFNRYGAQGITKYALSPQGIAEFSDDTQMTLFTATGLLYAYTKAKTDGIPENKADYISHVARSYYEWYLTQRGPYPLTLSNRESWLTNVPELFDLRAPGNTCMSAARVGAKGTLAKPVNNSRGCGGVMRVAPVGLFFDAEDGDISYAEIQRQGAAAAAATHGHPLAWLPSAVLAHIVSKVAHDSTATIAGAVADAMDTLAYAFPECEPSYIDTMLEELRQAVQLSKGEQDDLTAIHTLGEGWIGDEALAVAVYCALRYPDDIDRCLIAAVNHKGDSDSTGAVAGNIVGAKVGLQGIPRKYTDLLELRNIILEIADDLYQVYPSSADEKWAHKYITCDHPVWRP